MGAIIAIIFGLIEFLVGARFLLLFLGANPATPFVTWIYQWSTPLIAPFAGILGQPVVNPVGTVVHSIFEPSTLVALVVYGAVGGILLRVFSGWGRS
jgi:hypothetical protein